MRKVILSMMVSVDGFIEGPGHDLYWHVWDDEMADTKYIMGFFETVNTWCFSPVQMWPLHLFNITLSMNTGSLLILLHWDKEHLYLKISTRN